MKENKTIEENWQIEFRDLLNIYIEGFGDYKKPSLHRELRADRDTRALYDFIRNQRNQIEQARCDTYYEQGYEQGKKEERALLREKIKEMKIKIVDNNMERGLDNKTFYLNHKVSEVVKEIDDILKILE